MDANAKSGCKLPTSGKGYSDSQVSKFSLLLKKDAHQRTSSLSLSSVKWWLQAMWILRDTGNPEVTAIRAQQQTVSVYDLHTYRKRKSSRTLTTSEWNQRGSSCLYFRTPSSGLWSCSFGCTSSFWRKIINWEGNNNHLITDPSANWPLMGVMCISIIEMDWIKSALVEKQKINLSG